MRSFAITAFATLAFGIFCSAAPVPQGDILIPVDADVPVNVNVKRGAEEYTNYTTSYSTSTSYSTLYSTSTSTSYYPSSTSYSSSSSEDKCLESVIEGAVTEITSILDKISETL